MKKIIVLLIVFSSFFSVFASFDYGLKVDSVYNTKDNNISFSFIPYVEIGEFKLHLRTNWRTEKNATGEFINPFTFDTTNAYDIMSSIFKFIQKVVYGDFDKTFYVGLDRELTFNFENNNCLFYDMGKGLPAYFQVNTPYIFFNGFIEDVSFEKTQDFISGTDYDSLDYEFRNNNIGIGVLMAHHKLSPITLGLNLLYNYQSRYFSDNSSFSVYNYFTPQLSLSYNKKLSDDMYLKVGASGSLDMPSYSFSNEDEGILYDKWNRNFAVTVFSSLDYKNYEFDFTLFTNQKELTYRRLNKDVFYDTTEELIHNYVPGTSYGFAFDLKYKINENVNIAFSYVLPLNLSGKFDIFNYNGRTFDNISFRFDLDLGKTLSFNGGFEIDGLVGMIRNKEEFIKNFNLSSSSINMGVKYELENVSFSGKVMFDSIDIETKKPNISAFIGVSMGIMNFIK